MTIIKCKMCGGDLNIAEGATVAECEYCGSVQTVPTVDHEKKLTLFGRANRLRLACEFDKAAGVYESIVAEFPEEAEAYWGLVLCRYGIEYVDDPRSGKKTPTCHRSSFDSIMEDSDFEQTLENADVVARRVYRDEAKTIEKLRKGILEVSGKEEPYDIFICYKETDEKGDRTIDSVIAQDVYDALTEKGYRVFFSRISLEDKLGTEYEPYVFAALNSAKIMLAFGTDYEYYNAVWVKNEWSRFLALIAAGQKKTLIPCYKDIDAYDMPKEFARLQAQDMGKVGAIQDLLRGIDKIMADGGAEHPKESAPVRRSSGEANMEVLLKRGSMALEDGKWNDAKGFFNRALDIDPELALAYLGIAMANARCRTEEVFWERYTSTAWEDDSDTARAKQYATRELQKKFERGDAERAKIAAEEKRAAEEVAERAKKEAERTEREAKDRAKKEAKKAAERAARGARLRPAYAEHRKRIALAQNRICVASGNIFGLNIGGRVVAAADIGEAKYFYDLLKWEDIVAITAKQEGVVGLKANGTVVVTGYTTSSIDYVRNWTDIVAISASYNHTVGLKTDGTVIANGNPEYGKCNVWDWTNIMAIAAYGGNTVGLKTDGTVVAVGWNQNGELLVGDWTEIVAIAGGGDHTVGLRADGMVVATGANGGGQCDVSNWTDIVAIAAGAAHTVGLKLDGTVVAAGRNEAGQCDVSNWTDIVAVAARDSTTVGIKSDGTVVNTHNNETSYKQFSTSNWKLFGSVDTIEQEIEQAIAQAKARRQAELEKKRRAERHAALQKEKADLQVTLSILKGPFYGRRRREIGARLAQIETELNNL